MAIGLKRGTVVLSDHDSQWETIAAQTIKQLWRVFGSVAKDIQHVGSTAIINIQAKPIIDIAVAVDDFTEVDALIPALENAGFLRRHWETDDQMLFAVGDYVKPDGMVTHFIHAVKTDSTDWHNYINFRNYLNANPSIAKAYETLKVRLAAENPLDKGREKYIAGKAEFIKQTLQDALSWSLTRDIPGQDTFIKIEPLTKGWSGDKKYSIETADGRRMLLRVSDISELDRKKADYEMMERAYALGVPTSKPLGFGRCDGGKSVYSLAGWLDGKSADMALPHMTDEEQYILGVKMGEVLQKIHALPAPEYTQPWDIRFDRKVQSWVDEYESKPQIHSDTGKMLVCYLENHRNVLDSRLQTFIHGDCNIENIILLQNGEISVIDFNSYNSSYGDPWWDINNMAWMPTMFPHFYTGQMKGLFNGEPPTEFWNVFSYYLAYDALAALTDPYGLNGIEDGTEIVNSILEWTDNFKNLVPTWYLQDFCV